jgi:hypothetical protein
LISELVVLIRPAEVKLSCFGRTGRLYDLRKRRLMANARVAAMGLLFVRLGGR